MLNRGHPSSAAAAASDAKRQEIRAWVDARMANGEPFLYSDLYMRFHACTVADASRIADQCIQRWRRKGWVGFTREGRKVIWSLTDAGKQACANGVPPKSENKG